MVHPKGTVMIIFTCFLSMTSGVVDLSCNEVDPMERSALKCTGRNTDGNGVLWYKNDEHMTDCYLRTAYCLGYAGCSFSVNSSANQYTLSVDSYNYENCDVYTCRDLSKPEVNATKKIAARNSTSISVLEITEPKTNHTSGFIGITTRCIYGASSEVKDLDIQWLLVMESEEIPFHPENTTKKSNNKLCHHCDGDKATQFSIGFYHKQEMGCQEKEAKFKIILRHNHISSEPLNITTRNVYCVSDQTADGFTKWRSTISYCWIVFGCLLIQYFVLGLMFIHSKRNKNLPGKMKSCFTKLRRPQDKSLVLAFFPVFGFIGIIAYIYTCCSGTDTEGTSASVVSVENAEKEPKLLTEVEGKQPDNLNDVVSVENAEKEPTLLIEIKRRQPNKLNDGCPF